LRSEFAWEVVGNCDEKRAGNLAGNIQGSFLARFWFLVEA
jgi:hypothetical protein